MPAGYVIAQLKVTNPENYKEYVEKVTPLVKKFGGEFLVRAGEFQIFDGKTKFIIPVICLFGSGDGEERRAMLKTMGIIIEKEHKMSLGSAPTTEAIQRCLANGMKQV